MNVEMADSGSVHNSHVSDNKHNFDTEELHKGHRSDAKEAVQNPVLAALEPLWEKEPGTKQVVSNGFYGTTSRLLVFDMSLVRSFVSVIVSRDLTAFATIQQWMDHLGMVMFALFLMVVLGQNCFPDGEMGKDSACDDDNPKHNRNMCQLLDVMEDAKDDFQFLIAFILAGYVAGSLASWSSRRSLYSSLCGSARNLMVLVTSTLPLGHSNDEVMAARKTLCRWIMLAFELAMLRPRGKMDADEGREYLLSRHLLESGEWDAMVCGERHTTVNWWIQMELRRLAHMRLISPVALPTLQTYTSSMRAQANDLMLHLDQDKPFPYVALCGMLVKCNVLLMSTWRGTLWATWYFTLGTGIVRTPKFWLDILALFAWNMGYTALYQLGYILYNPFGSRRIDVPHEIIHDSLYRLSVELPEATEHLPPHLKSAQYNPPSVESNTPSNHLAMDF